MAGAKKKGKGVKPPIKPALPQVEVPTAAPIVPEVQRSAMDPYASARERMLALPSVGEALTSERIQATFAHLFLMSTQELNELIRRPQNLSILEVQIIRLLLRTLRDLPNKYENDVDEEGNQKYDKNGKPLKRLAGLHKDQLQNERQALETMRYLHERAFGRTKVTLEHTGNAPGTETHFHIDSVLDAMDNLPPDVIDIVANQIPAPKK